MFKLFIFCFVIYCIYLPVFADIVNVHWGDNIITTCESDGDIIVPNQTPTPSTGYHFVGWKQGPRHVEYIQPKAGIPYIDTGIIYNSNIKVDVIFRQTNENNAHLFGARNSGVAGNGFAFGIVNNNFVFDFNNRVVYTNASSTNGQWCHLIKDKYKNQLDCDGIPIPVEDNIDSSFSGIPTITLFCIDNIEGAYTGTFAASVKHMKIYDNDLLVRDLIPVVDENDVPCMYDKVENKFYYNQRTGKFYAGPIIDMVYSNLYKPGNIISNACKYNGKEFYFYPQFEPNEIALNWDDGTNITQNTCQYGGAITLPPTPVRSGYKFGGWKIKKNN